jgi:prepilin-type N-terminal cleavage/methylation domain-containing protein
MRQRDNTMKMNNSSKAGFSLVEILVAMTISVFILASSYATIISLAKGSESMINFSEMNTQTRATLEIFGRDARMCDDVHVFTATKFTGLREVYDAATSSYVDRFITYEYVSQAGIFSRSVNKVATVKGAKIPGTLVNQETLLFDVEQMSFYYYRLVDPEIPNYDPIARTVLEVKHIQLEAKLKRTVLNLDNTNYIISARFMMRNKDVGE